MKRLVMSMLLLVSGTSLLYAQTQTERMLEGRLPNREPSSAMLQMYQFGEKKVGEPLYLKPSSDFTEYHLNIAQYVHAEAGKPITLTIRRAAQLPVHIDRIVMVSGGKTIKPIQVLADGRDITKKMRDLDEDCACFQELTLVFPPATAEELSNASLMLLAAAGDESREVMAPLQPKKAKIVQSATFYDYVVGSRKGSLTLDGKLSPTEQLGKPSYQESFSMALGKIKKPLRIWAMDDGRMFSVALDVASDNTVEDVDDKAILYVRGASGMKAFTASATKEPYGRMGTSYTDGSANEHRVYEFLVPLSALPEPQDGVWGIAFAVTM